MRTRSLKPGFFENELLAELDPLARILFEGLWGLADRAGRLEDRPRRIKAKVLPYDNCDCDELLFALAEVMDHDNRPAFIIRYLANDSEGHVGRFIQIVNFTKHQKPHYKELPSEIPAPSDWEPPLPAPEDDDDQPIIDQPSTDDQPIVVNDQSSETQLVSPVLVNRNQELLTGVSIPPTPQKGGVRRALQVVKRSKGQERVACFMTIMKQAEIDPMLRPQDAKALKDSTAEVDLIAKAFIDCAQGRWQNWVRDNSLNVQTIIGKLASYQQWIANGRRTSNTFRQNRYVGTVDDRLAMESAEQA
jgi:hypothetical protein